MPMSFKYFSHSIENNYAQLPNEEIRELQQAAISDEWDCTSSRYTIQEQDSIGSDSYHDIEVWINEAMGATTRGQANGDDFKHLLFEDINHSIERGLYYKFDNNTWITHYTDRYTSLDKDIGVRRCNNVMRIVDPESGKVFSAPCAIDYDASSPYMQTTTATLIPNSHAVVYVQGNEDTLRLFNINKRFILGGRPYKLYNYQNMMIDENIAVYPTYLTIDLYLDELHAGDDIENQIADNGEYVYAISIDSGDMDLPVGSTGKLNATITLNGQEVNRDVLWRSENPAQVTIDNDGNYEVVGAVGDVCEITVSLAENTNITAHISIKVTENVSTTYKVAINPMFDKIRQYDTVSFIVNIDNGVSTEVPVSSSVSLSSTESIMENQYVRITKNGNNYSVNALKISPSQQTLYITASDSQSNEFVGEIAFNVVSMMG